MKKNILLLILSILILEIHTKDNMIKGGGRIWHPKSGNGRIWLAPATNNKNNNEVNVQTKTPIDYNPVWLARPRQYNNTVKVQGGSRVWQPKSGGRIWLAPPKDYKEKSIVQGGSQIWKPCKKDSSLLQEDKNNIIKVQTNTKSWLARPKKYKPKTSKIWFTYKGDENIEQ